MTFNSFLIKLQNYASPITSKCLKKLVLPIVLLTSSATVNAALIRYDFNEDLDSHVPESELFSGYYIFDTEISNTSTTINTGNFFNAITEIGINYSGQSTVFNSCLSSTCSRIYTHSSAEDHYGVNVNLYDSTGARSISFDLVSDDMYHQFNPDQSDVLIGFYNQSFTSGFGGTGNISFTFEGENGAIFSDISPVYTLTRVGEVPIPSALWLLFSGLIGLAGVASRRNK